MKNTLFVCLLALCFFFSCHYTSDTVQLMPAPMDTVIKWDMEDGTKPDRKVWEDQMHRSEEGTHWENIEFQNSKQLIKYRDKMREEFGQRDPGVPEVIVDGHLFGAWYEKGSNNQSGNVTATEYDVNSNKIYTISGGGNLWRGNLDGSEWTPINEDIKLFSRILHLFPDGRMFAFSRGTAIYSDDEGATWNESAGFYVPGGGWNLKNSTKVLHDDGTGEIFILTRQSGGQNIKVHYSDDKGSSFVEVAEFNNSNILNFAINKPIGTTDVYLMEQINANLSNIHKWNRTSNSMEIITENSPLAFGNGRGNLEGALLDDGTLRLYAYNGSNDLFYTEDFGESWNLQGQIPITPWQLEFYISPSDPNFMFTGGVNAYRSLDAGQTWFEINDWSDYYGDVNYKLHADMMAFNEFVDPDGNPFLLISNHGGMSVSYNQGLLNENIGLEGLNVSQYYSVASTENNPTYVFAGSQDQGFQRGRVFGFPVIADFQQAISGDYGHIVFTQNEARLWTVYPGGWVTYYHTPFNEGLGYTTVYEIDSPNESVWIPPMISQPKELTNIVYIAGGSSTGESGRHIIKMEYVNGQIVGENLPFDFSVSGGEISAMAINEFNEDIWYVATSNGKVYKSTDGAQSFYETESAGPGGHYLYGSDILASKLDENLLWLAGSGYSNAGILKSIDGGETWEDMSNGLPATLSFGIATNEDESLMFAATESGPFVYVRELDQWFPLSGTDSAPFTRYWSVQYVPQLKTARFGTYGRGVWDFEVIGTSSSEDFEDASSDFKLYPNPAINDLSIDFGDVRIANDAKFVIFAIDGKEMMSKDVNVSNIDLNISSLVEGTYIARFMNGDYQRSKIFIKQNN